MSSIGLGYSTLGYGTVNSGSPSGNFDASTLMPALMNIVNQAGSKIQTPVVQSPLDEHKAYWRELSVETRAAIESNEEYQTVKMQMLQEFLVWCVGGTELGQAFASGPGSTIVKELTSLAKKLEPQLGRQRNQEVEDLRQQVAELTQILRTRGFVEQGNATNNVSETVVAEVKDLRKELTELKQDLGSPVKE